MLSREKQIPHYTAHMGTQADGTHLSAVTFFLLQSCFERIKTCLQDCSKIFQAASSDLFSRFEDLFSPFLAVLPTPSVLPRKASACGAEADFVEALLLPTTEVPTAPLDLSHDEPQSHGTRNWAQKQQQGTCNSVKLLLPQLLTLAAPTLEEANSFHVLKHRQTLSGMPLFGIKFLLESLPQVRKKKQSHLPYRSTLPS